MSFLLPAVGTVLQLIALLMMFVPGGLLDWPWYLGIPAVMGLVGCLLFGFSALRQREDLSFRVLGIVGAAIGSVGWSSWIWVAFTSNPDDPAVNIVGLLSSAGTLIAWIAFAVAFINSRTGPPSTTYALWFWLGQVGFALFSFARYSVDALDALLLNTFWLISAVPVVIGAVQMAVALRATAPTLPKQLSLAGASFYLISAICLGLLEFITILATLLTAIAGVLEFVDRRKQRASSPNEPPDAPTS